MGKISAIDKIWMQTSREHESWRESHNRGMETEHSEEICRCDQLCQRIGKLALAVDNRRVFVRWKPSKMWVSWLIRSQEGQSRTHLSTRQVASESSVINTVNLELFGHQITNDAVRQKRLERIESLLRRLNPRQTKQVFTDEKIFISSHPSASRTAASGQRGRKWTSLVTVCSLNAKSLRSTWWCRLECVGGGKDRLLFVDKKANVNTYSNIVLKHSYVGRPLPKLIADCKHLLPCPPASSSSKTVPCAHCTRHAGLAASELSRVQWEEWVVCGLQLKLWTRWTITSGAPR